MMRNFWVPPMLIRPVSPSAWPPDEPPIAMLENAEPQLEIAWLEMTNAFDDETPVGSAKLIARPAVVGSSVRVPAPEKEFATLVNPIVSAWMKMLPAVPPVTVVPGVAFVSSRLFSETELSHVPLRAPWIARLPLFVMDRVLPNVTVPVA